MTRIWFAIGLCLALAGCSAPKKTETSESVKKYQLKGEVLSVDPSAHLAKVKHQKIEGWMEAMTMDYPVKDETEFKKLSVGQSISATVYVEGQDYWLGEIK